MTVKLFLDVLVLVFLGVLLHLGAMIILMEYGTHRSNQIIADQLADYPDDDDFDDHAETAPGMSIYHD